jgi:hypothetical protein
MAARNGEERMSDRIPISSRGKIVYYSPRRRRPWRLWWIAVALPFVVAALVDVLR